MRVKLFLMIFFAIHSTACSKEGLLYEDEKMCMKMINKDDISNVVKLSLIDYSSRGLMKKGRLLCVNGVGVNAPTIPAVYSVDLVENKRLLGYVILVYPNENEISRDPVTTASPVPEK